MKYLFLLVFLLVGCAPNSQEDDMKYCGVESLGEWNDITWMHYITDDLDDYVFHGGDVGPDPIVPYKASDLVEAAFSYDEEFVYVKFVFNDILPDDSVKVDANGEELYVHAQGMNLAINFDHVETEGSTGSMWGVDAFFAVNVMYYSECIEPYAPYQFDSTDIHSMTASVYGDSHPTLGGFGTNYVIARYPIELLKDNFNYQTFQIFGWAEAEAFTESEYTHDLKGRFHEFVHDDLETTYYNNKSTN